MFDSRAETEGFPPKQSIEDYFPGYTHMRTNKDFPYILSEGSPMYGSHPMSVSQRLAQNGRTVEEICAKSSLEQLSD